MTAGGDIRGHDEALAIRRATSCAAVMIGRDPLGAASVFRAAPTTDDDHARTIRRHCAQIQEHLSERAALLRLKKHLSCYSSGRPFARPGLPLFAVPSVEAVQSLFWRHWHEGAA